MGTTQTAPMKGAPMDMMSGRKLDKPATDRNSQYPKTAMNPGQTDAAKGFTPARENEVWVKKWVDYSSKYGLGYFLSNEATGVFFNDSTKIVLDPNGFHFDYMERRSADRQDVGLEYTLSDYPKDL
jgi:polo-like kinase 1